MIPLQFALRHTGDEVGIFHCDHLYFYPEAPGTVDVPMRTLGWTVLTTESRSACSSPSVSSRRKGFCASEMSFVLVVKRPGLSTSLDVGEVEFEVGGGERERRTRSAGRLRRG
jgi:hypothetical protein